MKYIIAIIATLFAAMPSFAQLKLQPVQDRKFQTELERVIAKTQMQNLPVISRDQEDPRVLHWGKDTYKASDLKKDYVGHKNPEMTPRQKLAHALFGKENSSDGSTMHLTLTKQQFYDLNADDWIFVGDDVAKTTKLMTIQDWQEVFRDTYESAGYDRLTKDPRNPKDVMVSYKQEFEDGSIGYVAIRIFENQGHVFAVSVNKLLRSDNSEIRRHVFHGLEKTPQEVFLVDFGNKEDCQFGDDCY